ncbi:hypothetical protein S1361_33555 [Streptomyces cyanogenus]|uniref:Uncharacterized protein n=1 Tax=Streptomyces cyanogenus TaxID=80860 RepID=A0ABX7TZV2_STRCY|nr:hypothetical protein S1361_33555 [Streptomyces cyanogenus]
MAGGPITTEDEYASPVAVSWSAAGLRRRHAVEHLGTGRSGPVRLLPAVVA